MIIGERMWLLLFYVQLSRWGAAGPGHPQPGVLTAVSRLLITSFTSDTRAPMKPVACPALVLNFNCVVWPLHSSKHPAGPVSCCSAPQHQVLRWPQTFWRPRASYSFPANAHFPFFFVFKASMSQWNTSHPLQSTGNRHLLGFGSKRYFGHTHAAF